MGGKAAEDAKLMLTDIKGGGVSNPWPLTNSARHSKPFFTGREREGEGRGDSERMVAAHRNKEGYVSVSGGLLWAGVV